MSPTDASIADIIDAQIKRQGLAVSSVKDGHVFTFTAETLRTLLAKAEKTGRVVLFVQMGLPQ